MTGKTQHEELLLEDLQTIRLNIEANVIRESFIETITFNGVGTELTFEDWGANWTEVVNAPTGFKGQVLNIAIINVQETFNLVAAGARVDIGTTADNDAYANSASLATAAVPVSPAVTFSGYIPGGEDFLVTGVASDHGTPAGQATLALTIAWIKE
jgi:hypothetical protein